MKIPEGYKKTGLGILPEDWEVVSIGEIFKITRGNVLATEKISPHQNNDDIYPVFSSKTKDGGLLGFYREYLFEDCITWTTDGANAGDVNFRKGKFYCTNVCGVLINMEGYSNLCVAESLNAVAKKYVSYVGNPKLMNNVMENITIPLPPLAEQEKIAEILSTWDTQIQNLESLIQEKQNLKKGLMQQLLSQALRLKGFNGDWEVVRLGEVCVSLKKGTLATSELKSNGYPVINSGRVLYGYYSNFNNNCKAFTIAARGEYAGFINFIEGKFWAGGLCYPYCSNNENKLLTKFIFYHLKSREQNIMDFLVTQTSIPAINKMDCEKIKIPLPPLAEQEKIAEILSGADDEITLLAQKLESLKTQKKGLMQQLLSGKMRVRQ